MGAHGNDPWMGKTGMTITLRRNDRLTDPADISRDASKQMDKALRMLKKRCQQEGLNRDLRRIEYYESKAVKRRRKRAESIRRCKKAQNQLRLEDSYGYGNQPENKNRERPDFHA
jgi:small subunit ribosomal protein S21